MRPEVSCIVTKALIPFVEREVGPEGVAALLRRAGRPREWLMAEYNRLPLSVADDLVRLAMTLMGETDEERWARRAGEDWMDWKPSREERGWGGTYSMSLGSPGAVYRKRDAWGGHGYADSELLAIGRRRATLRQTPFAGTRLPRWVCTIGKVILERLPTNWGLPRAKVVERQCAVTGADACIVDVSWKNPPLGARFWGPAAGGALAAVLLAGLAVGHLGAAAFGLATLPLLAGTALGYGFLKDGRQRQTQRMLELLGEEVLYSSRELERKFGDLETKVGQLSLLIELSQAVNATLDPERIYEQALQRLVHGMGYQGAFLFLVDHAQGIARGHAAASRDAALGARFEGIELPLTPEGSIAGKVATTGQPVLVADVGATPEPVDVLTARAFGVSSLVAFPLRVKDRIFGVLAVASGEVDRLSESDVELVSAVASHVALAVDKAESFGTIEGLSRGLEDKVRVRTEQLRAAHEELQGAHRDLQHAQMQLVQREKMASVGQLVAGVAHELNNPIGFVYSNVATLEDFTRRLRAMLEVYRQAPLAEAAQTRIQAEWDRLKVDYALRYLDAMTQGIREGAERARKIVRDLRVFARGEDDIWQPVDLHAELESSLTLVNHLLEDRVAVHRKYGELPSVECVRSQIDQVFLNLLANAAQAIQGPGAITIETRCDDGAAVLRIRDTGPGIPPDVIGRIFDPFFTTKPVGEGTGLGLSISYEIVKRHGGEIAVTSPPGGGAVFTVRLPLARVS
jgi:two-component system, NtrC family, sensor kinase